jgi:dTDP-4-dehydrorhamnose 3,5-epimerase-like enzyme
MNRDSRGSFTEVFREEWDTGLASVHWNVVSSEAGTLRGVHLHIRHDDHLTTLKGRACVGLFVGSRATTVTAAPRATRSRTMIRPQLP